MNVLYSKYKDLSAYLLEPKHFYYVFNFDKYGKPNKCLLTRKNKPKLKIPKTTVTLLNYIEEFNRLNHLKQ